MSVRIRDAGAADSAFILALNAACTPAVSELDATDLADIVGWSHRVLIAEAANEAGGSDPAGFIILIRPGSAYPSDNYGWFEAKYDRHLYVDRIAVSDAARGRGVGRALYDEAARIAAETGEQRITCEVNEQPPNPESMAFHARLGFRHLHSRMSRHAKVVAMLAKEISP